MYTYEQRMKAVELYIKYEHRAKAVSRELGYPHPNLLSRWYKEYLESGYLKSGYNRGQKYSQEQKNMRCNITKNMVVVLRRQYVI